MGSGGRGRGEEDEGREGLTGATAAGNLQLQVAAVCFS
jgi:hypothetical protein